MIEKEPEILYRKKLRISMCLVDKELASENYSKKKKSKRKQVRDFQIIQVKKITWKKKEKIREV